jgi:hypothetical protein
MPVQEVPTVVPADGQIMRQESEQLSQSCCAGLKIWPGTQFAATCGKMQAALDVEPAGEIRPDVQLLMGPPEPPGHHEPARQVLLWPVMMYCPAGQVVTGV